MFEVVAAHRRHIAPIARQMRAIDRLECAAAGRSPAASLTTGLLASLQPQVALLDRRPVAMWGVVPVNAMEGRGRPWLLGTDAVNANPTPLLMGARAWLAYTSAQFPHLSNWCAAENRQARTWLRRLGFVFGQPVTMRGVPMIPFERRS